MITRQALEDDHEVRDALASWDATSISACAAFILERLYRFESLGLHDVHAELKKHVDYFCFKAKLDLPLIVHGWDFMVEKAVFLEFVRNCLEVCRQMDSKGGTNREPENATVSAATALRPTENQFRSITEALVRIQTQLALSAFVHNANQEETRQRILRLGTLLTPTVAADTTKIRVGGQSDGGYVMLNDFDKIVGALSFGVNDDDGWDRDIASREIEVHQYDHTIAQAPTQSAKLKFFPEMITGQTHSAGTSLAKATGRHTDGSLLLKCDIEGSEWEVFASATTDTLARFSQIVCEFHSFGSIVHDHFYQQAEEALEKLGRAFGVVHVHANNSGPFLILGGVPFPSVLEVTFASRARYKLVESNDLFPTEIDRPNAPLLPDHYLGNFRFTALVKTQPE